MSNVLKLFVFVLAVVMLSCADYKELDLSIKNGGGIKDNRDGADEKPYETVIIGEQEWMARNLIYKTGFLGRCYGDLESNCNILGGLYTWAEAMGLDSTNNNKSPEIAIQEPFQGICPNGWHLPSYEEWMELLDYVGSKEGSKLKTTNGWERNGTNEYGFSAISAGCHYEGEFQRKGKCGAWWSISEATSKTIKSIQICDDDADLISFLKASWASIRCVKD